VSLSNELKKTTEMQDTAQSLLIVLSRLCLRAIYLSLQRNVNETVSQMNRCHFGLLCGQFRMTWLNIRMFPNGYHKLQMTYRMSLISVTNSREHCFSSETAICAAIQELTQIL
jgi:hypothetical protein